MQDLIDNLGLVRQGIFANVQITAMSALLALVLGTVLAAMRVSPVPVLRAAGTAYVNVLRNAPLTLVLLFCSLGIGDTLHVIFSENPQTNGFWLATIGLSAYTAAFVCESLRSGINTVPLGQAEAARSIGLTFMQSLRLIVLPQAFRSVVAPLGSVLIALTKNSTLAFIAGYAESALLMRDHLDEVGANPVPLFAGFAIGFMCITLPTGFFFSWLSKRVAVVR